MASKNNGLEELSAGVSDRVLVEQSNTECKGRVLTVLILHKSFTPCMHCNYIQHFVGTGSLIQTLR